MFGAGAIAEYIGGINLEEKRRLRYSISSVA